MGLVHPKIKIVSSFYSTFVPNLYECISSAEHKIKYV